ncbi:MAG: hypothetical protein KDC75_20695 [Phaeodactylibacter sp.]|nr:hypothetical protein [Phaeodactylibacter sp.]
MTKRKMLPFLALGFLLVTTGVRAEDISNSAMVRQDSSRANTQAFTPPSAPFGILAGFWGGSLSFPYPALDAPSALPAIAANGPVLYSLMAGLPSREAVFNGYLQRLAGEYESQHILYRSVPLSDCSGMFHRLLQQMKAAFPAFVYPEVTEARSTRALAQWYYDRNALHIIEDAANSGHLIKPGAIMFFGQIGKKYRQPSIEQLTTYGQGIMHIGTVIEVEKDEQGQVTAYTMFHARGRGKPASHTRHYLQRPNNSSLPAFGNWRQQWIAVAYIDTQ